MSTQKHLNVFETHQKRIAIATLKMSDAGAMIMGGMTKAEAIVFLRSIQFSERSLHSLVSANHAFDQFN